MKINHFQSKMHLFILLLLSLSFSISSIDSSQCAPSPDLAGHCGCCRIIGGSCVHFSTVDDIAVSWHVCVPESRRETFSLKECKPSLIPDQNSTRLCRTKNGTFRFFPQCVKKTVCSIALPKRNGNNTEKMTRQCSAPKAVAGSCNQTLTRYTFDAHRRACVPFTYSGCGGSTNQFYFQKRCEKLCIKSKSN